MKKISTYYLLILSGANIWLTWFFPWFTKALKKQWSLDLQGSALPQLTELFLQASWWPVVFAALFLLGAIISIVSNRRCETMLHLVVVGLMVEAVVLFYAVVGYAIPCIRVMGPLH